MSNPIKDKIKIWGGIKVVSDLLEAPYNTISSWCRGIRSPAPWIWDVCQDAMKLRTMRKVWFCRVCNCATGDTEDGVAPNCAECGSKYVVLHLAERNPELEVKGK